MAIFEEITDKSWNYICAFFLIIPYFFLQVIIIDRFLNIKQLEDSSQIITLTLISIILALITGWFFRKVVYKRDVKILIMFLCIIASLFSVYMIHQIYLNIDKGKDAINSDVAAALIDEGNVETNTNMTPAMIYEELVEDKPLTLTPSQITINEGGQEERVQVVFYNPSPVKKYWKIEVRNADTNSRSNVTAIAPVSSFVLLDRKSTAFNITFKAKDGLVASAETQAASLYSVTVCSVSSLSAVDCEPDAEIYQKEVLVTVKN